MRDRTSLRLLERFHDTTASLSERTARAVERLLVPHEDTLAADLRAFVEDALPIWTAAQTAAIDLAGAFFEVYGSYETDDEVQVVERIPLTTRNGVTLEESLVGIPANVYTKLKEGSSFNEALHYGHASAVRLIQTEVMDAAQRELSSQMKASPLCDGWRWKSRGTCGACAAMDSGERLPDGAPLNRHPNCRCIAEPTFRGVRERIQRETGRERFLRAAVAVQNEMFGAEKAELVRTGVIAWEALVHVARDGFKPKVTETPLEQLT